MALKRVLTLAPGFFSPWQVGKQLDLLKFSQVYGFEFQPSRFAACSIRLRSQDPRCRSTALAFTSGKFVITGARSQLESLLAARSYVGLLNRLGERLSFLNFSIQNIVSSVDFGRPLMLHEIIKHTDCCSWENRKFPGLVLRDPHSKLVVLAFRSGKCVITGSKSRAQLYAEWPRLYAKLAAYVDTENDDKCSRTYAARLRQEEDNAAFDPDPLFL